MGRSHIRCESSEQKNRNIKLFIAFLWTITITLLSVGQVFAQTVSVPLSHWAYDAVERWEVRGFISGVFNGSRPFTREEMSGYIEQVWEFYQKEPEKFSEVDLNQLYYLNHEFQEELDTGKKQLLPHLYEQWRPRLYYLFRQIPFKYLNSLIYTNNRNMINLRYREFRLFGDPVLSYSVQERMEDDFGDYQFTRVSNGFLFYGFLGQNLGFYFNLTDNHASDDRWKNQEIPFEVLEESGWPYLTTRENGDFEFDENIATITFHHKYFYLLFGREYNQWGTGHHGNLLLSTNAPVYDQFKLIIRYWRFKFTHLTAFLQYISPAGRISMKSEPHIDQYWSGNRLELNLGKGIQLGLSEAVVYGDRSLQPGYLNPLSFFKSLEHYYGDRDNGILGVDMEWRIRNGIKLFGEWFIDDITTTKLGTDWYGNKFGWQTGIFWVNPFSVRDTDLMAEYTRIKPYVYTHSYRDYNKYKHYDTVLGHFIGPNSDDIFIRLRRRFSKFLNLSLEYEKYRHGSNTPEVNVGGNPDRPKEDGDSPRINFLEGIPKGQESFGASIQYEFVRNLFGELYYRRTKFQGQGNEWQDLFSMRISLNFGFREEKIRHIFPVNY
ncbi:MAG: hypothetical protein EH225_05875 [Calditrichaeota bacterium]|nr:hypothetical protein [Calditrichota bacterium]RQV93135.1 MAG: hypothetical protein EH221_10215 [bacterium]RQW04492.1 MAG: hypothetical protein EH225_05875 [Calditrichota bacterium]